MLSDPTQWLHAAADAINPSRTPSLSASVSSMVSLTHRLPPPPARLRRHWLEMIRRWPGEPPVFYLTRCLAFHYHITLLSPHLVPQWEDITSSDQADQWSLHWQHWPFESSATSAHSTLPQPPSSHMEKPLCHLFRVIGLHVVPVLAEYIATGWEVLGPCSAPGCLRWLGVSAPTGASPQLPLVLGGASCDGCGQLLERRPTLSLRARVVLELKTEASTLRCSAVVLGESNTNNMVLGQWVRCFYYHMPPRSGCTERRLAVHSAVRAFPMERARFLCLKSHHVSLGPFLPPVSKPLSFTRACELFEPNVLGQPLAIRALLLSTLYTIYGGYIGEEVGVQDTLHTALIGPTQSGKSSLLRAVKRLWGDAACWLAPGVVWSKASGSAKKGVKGTKGIEALWPFQSGGVLCGGAALLSEAILLEDTSALTSLPSARLRLLELLTSQMVTCPNPGLAGGQRHDHSGGGLFGAVSSGVADTLQFRLTSQFVLEMGVDDECASALLPGLRLLIPLGSHLSLEQSATVGDRVMSSASRGSLSRSQNSSTLISPTRRQSGSNCPSSSSFTESIFGGLFPTGGNSRMAKSDSQRSSSACSSQLHGRGFSPSPVEPISAAPSLLTGEALVAAVANYAPSREDMVQALDREEVNFFFLQKLYQHADVVGRSSAVVQKQPLAPPSCLRGSLEGPSVCSAWKCGNTREHLRTLRSLAMARLVLPEDDECTSGVGGRSGLELTQLMAEEVWEVYFASLCAAGRVMDLAASGLPTSSEVTSGPSSLAAQRVAVMGVEITRNGRKRTRSVGKKKCYSLFLQALQNASLERGGGNAFSPYFGGPSEKDAAFPEGVKGDVCQLEDASVTYEQLGGFAVFQENVEGVISRLQEMGMLIRRPGGWKVLKG